MSEKAPPKIARNAQFQKSGADGIPKSSIPDPTRRRFSRLGLGAPVLMTVLSKPVFGAQCLSNMLSGNLSDPTRGTCVKGDSPGGWKNPGGKIKSYSTLAAWIKAGFEYGKYVQTCGNPSQRSCYIEGATVSTAPFNTLLSVSDSTIPLRQILADEPGSLNAGIITAYLNAALSENDGTFKYVFTTAQVIGLANGTISLPTGTDLHGLLYSTW